jgi:hypothetical protein
VPNKISTQKQESAICEGLELINIKLVLKMVIVIIIIIIIIIIREVILSKCKMFITVKVLPLPHAITTG